MADDLNMAFSFVFILELLINLLGHWPRQFISNAWVKQRPLPPTTSNLTWKRRRTCVEKGVLLSMLSAYSCYHCGTLLSPWYVYACVRTFVGKCERTYVLRALLHSGSPCLHHAAVSGPHPPSHLPVFTMT